MRYLTLHEVLEAHEHILRQSGGQPSLLNLGALESALAQPRMTFGGQDLYATIVEKAAALGFSLIQNHPFVDGNKRTAHAAMETFLVLNGYQIEAPVEEQEDTILKVAAGKSGREAFTEWLRQHVQSMP
ncbi:MAG TPA: type II toxin-antitoxin system death-on-curing family toxin [Candidatus Tectomicrobia bacterium]